jgi:hypothetical protein
MAPKSDGLPILPGQRPGPPQLDNIVPRQLEILVHPHVSSFNVFLEEGLPTAVSAIDPVEVRRQQPPAAASVVLPAATASHAPHAPWALGP